MATENKKNASSKVPFRARKKVSSDAIVHSALKELEAFCHKTNMAADVDEQSELTARLQNILQHIEKSRREWFKYGFYSGHLHSYNAFLKTKAVPESFNRGLTRNFADPETKDTKFTVYSCAYDWDNAPEHKKEAYIDYAARKASAKSKAVV